MIDPFVEGVRSISQVCHLVILAPVAATVLAARGRVESTVGALVGVVVGGWLFATNVVGPPGELVLRLSAVAVIAAAVVAATVSRAAGTSVAEAAAGASGERLASPAGPPSRRALLAGIAGLVGIVVAQWWRPCVGVELGSILTAAPREPWGQLLPTAAFMVGLSTPLVLLGTALVAADLSRHRARLISWVGAGIVVVLAGSVVAGRHGEIVARLFELSQ